MKVTSPVAKLVKHSSLRWPEKGSMGLQLAVLSGLKCSSTLLKPLTVSFQGPGLAIWPFEVLRSRAQAALAGCMHPRRLMLEVQCRDSSDV